MGKSFRDRNTYHDRSEMEDREMVFRTSRYLKMHEYADPKSVRLTKKQAKNEYATKRLPPH
jgi:hypothetical protein